MRKSSSSRINIGSYARVGETESSKIVFLAEFVKRTKQIKFEGFYKDVKVDWVIPMIDVFKASR